MVGRADMLEADPETVAMNPKLDGVNLDKILTPAASLRPGVPQVCVQQQRHGLDMTLDRPVLIPAAKKALNKTNPMPITIEHEIKNTHRATGTRLSHEARAPSCSSP